MAGVRCSRMAQPRLVFHVVSVFALLWTAAEAQTPNDCTRNREQRRRSCLPPGPFASLPTRALRGNNRRRASAAPLAAWRKDQKCSEPPGAGRDNVDGVLLRDLLLTRQSATPPSTLDASLCRVVRAGDLVDNARTTLRGCTGGQRLP